MKATWKVGSSSSSNQPWSDQSLPPAPLSRLPMLPLVYVFDTTFPSCGRCFVPFREELLLEATA